MCVHAHKNLTDLNVSKNRLLEIPLTVCDLKVLKYLNVEKNNLLSVPQRLADMTLMELKIGYETSLYIN